MNNSPRAARWVGSALLLTIASLFLLLLAPFATASQPEDDTANAALPYGIITGTLTTDGSTPVDGEVRILGHNDMWWEEVAYSYSSGGSYTIGKLLPGTYRVQFMATINGSVYNEYYDDTGIIWNATDVEVLADTVTPNINAILGDRGEELSGFVSNEQGAPLGGIKVTLYDDNDATNGHLHPILWTYTDGKGGYTIGGLDPGTYRVGFIDPSGMYARQFYNNQPTLGRSTPITVVVGTPTTEIDGVLPLGGAISGTVTDPDGNPIPEGEVRLFNLHEDSWELVASEYFYQGNYSLGGLPGEIARVAFAGDVGGTWHSEFYDNVTTLEKAADVFVKAGATTTGIDAVLGDLVTPTATPTPDVTTTPGPTPIIVGVSPKQGPDDQPIRITIYGSNFVKGAQAFLNVGGEPVQLEGVSFIGSHRLRATVPMNLPVGSYALGVRNPDEQTATYPDAYEVLPASESNDLFALDNDLWNSPQPLRAGESATVGLLVRRQSGLGHPPLTATVSFYLGTPPDVTLIGSSSTGPLEPRSSAATTPISITLPAPGEYTLSAVIDPDNEILENSEANNIIQRTIRVLPRVADSTPPVITLFTIDDDDGDGEGSIITEVPTMTLTTHATDDHEGASGVGWLLFAEYEYEQNSGDWEIVAFSDSDGDGTPDWLPYEEAKEDYLWRHTPTPGIRYLQVWAADQAGNISSRGVSLINYVPPETMPGSIAQEQAHIFRIPALNGESWRVTLTSLTGNANLYVWSPDAEDLGQVETTDKVEIVEFTAEQDGTHQIEVIGATSSTYTLNIEAVEVLPAFTRSAISLRPRFDPMIAPTDTPTTPVTLPDAPLILYSLYLPTITH